MNKQYVIKNLNDKEYQYFQTCAPVVGGYWVKDIRDATKYSFKDAKYEDDTYMYYDKTEIVKVNFYLKEITIDFSLELCGNKNPLELYRKTFPTYESMKIATMESGIYSFEYGVKEVEE